MKRIPVLTTLTALVVLWTMAVFAAVPQLINFQGVLRDGSGNPVADGSYFATFRIYDAASGGTVLWADTQTVATSSGLFNAILGRGTPVPDSVFNDTARYLGVQIFPDPEMTPRQKLTSVGYTFRTEQWTSAGQDLFRLNGNVGVGIAPLSNNRLRAGNFGSDPAALIAFRGYGSNISGNAFGGYFDGFSSGGLGYGVYGEGSTYGAYGNSATYGVVGVGGNRGVTGLGGPTGVYGEGNTYGVYGSGPNGVVGFSTVGGGSGVSGFASGPAAPGIYGEASGNSGAGVYGSNGGNPTTWAGYFSGQVRVTSNLIVDGTINKSALGFKIDHPLDPANKYLHHSGVESPDMMNIYNGNVTLDAKGEAAIQLQDWFGVVNKDYRYQLTAIGAPGPNLYIAKEISGNEFKIAGGTAGMKVSWQVTGIRKDAYAEAHRIPVEEEKAGKEKGKYLHPTEHGAPTSLGMHYEEQQKMAAEREKMKEEQAKMEVERKKMEEQRVKMEQERAKQIED